jgi:hypothetical protein
VNSLRTPLIIAVAAALVGCSHKPPHQATAVSCTDERRSVCFNRTADSQSIVLASLKANPPARETKFPIAAKTENRPSHRTRNSARFATKKAAPATTAAKAQPAATRTPVLSPFLTSQLNQKSTASARPGATELNIADSRPTVDTSASPNGRTTQEHTATATAVPEQMTVGAVRAVRDPAEPVAGVSPNNPEVLVAIVMVRPEIGSVSDLTDKNIAIDERYSASSADVRMAIVAAGGLLIQLSTGRRPAIERLVNGEVPAAVLALVSADTAGGFPEVEGYRIFPIPLSPRP